MYSGGLPGGKRRQAGQEERGPMGALSSTMLDRFQRRTRLSYGRMVILSAALLLCLPLLGALLDGDVSEFFGGGYWRTFYLPPCIVVYILLVYPVLNRAQDNVVAALRPLVPLSDEDYLQMVRVASRSSPRVERLVFGAGFLLYVLMGLTWLDGDGFSWLVLSIFLTGGLMFGLLAWVIYSSLKGTRLMGVLHNQLRDVDLFDQRPFEPIGQASLMTVLAFIGGCTISLFFLITPQNILQPANLVVNGSLIAIAVVVFFLNMRPTHRALGTIKQQELRAMLQDIGDAYRRYGAAKQEGRDTGHILSVLDDLINCERRLKETRTWPYNTGTLRTLFFSVLIPAAAGAARIAAMFLFE